MRPFTDAEILDRVEQLSTFKGWKKGEYDIWIRSAADAFDQFDDRAYTYHCAKDGERPTFFMSRSGTTNAGSYGLKHFEDYNHEGCAVLKSDVIIYNSHTSGLHHGKAAYRQAKSWPYFRDANRNNKAEEIGPEHSGIIGANVHRAGVNSTVIKNWSTACLVTANLAKFQAFLAYMASQGKPPLTVAILKEWPKGAPSLASNSAAASGSSTGEKGALSGTKTEGSDDDAGAIPTGSSNQDPDGQEQPPTVPDIPTSAPNKTDVVVEKEPEVTETKPKGFLGSLWQKVTGALGGGVTADVAIEKAQQAQALGLSERTWTFIFWAIIAGLAIWIVYHFVVLKILPWGKYVLARMRTDRLVTSNGTADSVQVIAPDKLAEYEAKGYLVVRRS